MPIAKHNQAVARQRWMREFIEYKKTLSCMDCGIKDYRVLQFHHRDGNVKYRSPSGKAIKIATLVQTGNASKLAEYVKDCDVLCANCHVIRHYEERNNVAGDRPAAGNSDGSAFKADGFRYGDDGAGT